MRRRRRIDHTRRSGCARVGDTGDRDGQLPDRRAERNVERAASRAAVHFTVDGIGVNNHHAEWRISRHPGCHQLHIVGLLGTSPSAGRRGYVRR
jgi:hypothetical protein